ncbi:MAG: hypothetical protein ACXWG8_05225 [Usitatibacter sp.]
MSQVRRLLYAAVLSCVFAAMFILVTAVVAPDVMANFISHPYWIVVFVVSYLVAPYVSRYIKIS